MSSSIRIAHISDLHFSKIVFSPFQFFSKRWVGNANLILRRKNTYTREPLYALPSLFKELKIDLVVIAGDFTSTTHPEELNLAHDFCRQLEKKDLPFLSVPGNHDLYTKQAFRNKTFYQFFSNPPQTLSEKRKTKLEDSILPLSAFSLKTHGVEARAILPHWWIVLLDTVIATSLFDSSGYFSEQVEENLEKVLSQIPDKDSVILVNHFPFFHHDSPIKILRRGKELQRLIEKHASIKLYLHGHTHRHCIADLRANNLPIILDSGSAAHATQGSWNLLQLESEKCSVESYHWQPKKQKPLWSPSPKKAFFQFS